MTRAERLQQINLEISEAAIRSGRTKSEVTLVAVSKTFPAADVAAFSELGQLNFGENKVQEFVQKKSEIDAILPGNTLKWHAIGHLQRNKAKDLVAITSMFHALDSLKLASTLDQQLERLDLRLPCLIQVNVSGEESKFGIEPSELDRFVDAALANKRLEIMGLMTLASPADNPEDIRPEFAHLRTLANSVADRWYDPSRIHLSMGMSHDFKIAIEEGATLVRVGSSLFGSRNYDPT